MRSPRPVNVGVRLRKRDQREVGSIRERRGSKGWRPGVEMMGLRFAFTIPLLLGGLCNAVTAEAQQAAKVARVGWLARTDVDPATREAFLQGLRDLGYVEGRNVVIEYRDAEGRLERLPALAAELVALKVDVILAEGGTLGPRVAQQATRTIPIVFAAGDPVGSGLVTSL